MLIKSPDDRIILWRATVTDDCITAEIGYFDANLHAETYPLESGKTRYLVAVPESVRGQDFPGKAQKIALSIIAPTSQ